MNADKMQGDGISEAGRDVLLVAIEMGLKTWRLALARAGALRHRQSSIEAGNYLELHGVLARARERFGLTPQVQVIISYEAGREGFHPYRVLQEAGYTVWLLDSSSIEVDRRQRRAKNDALDAGRLLGLMQRELRGEGVLRRVRVPSVAQEDERQRSREREELRKECARLRVRMQSLLFAQGWRDFPKSLASIERWLSERQERLPGHLRARLGREEERLRTVTKQLRSLDQELRQPLFNPQQTASRTDRTAAHLCKLKGIGERGAWVLAAEMFGWREFRNRREVGAVAGVVPTPYDSGESRREQGISKAGNRRVRHTIVELAWMWLRHQPESALSQWFEQRFGGPGKRGKRIGIVALARRLLVDLWHYLEHGVIPRGAQLKA